MKELYLRGLARTALFVCVMATSTESANCQPVAAASADLTQPLTANVQRLLQSLEYLGWPLPRESTSELKGAIQRGDVSAMQAVLDRHVLCNIGINPEQRVRVSRGAGAAVIQQRGYTPLIVKVSNDATVTQKLSVSSPQSGAVFGGAADGSLLRQQQTELGKDQLTSVGPDRFLHVEMFNSSPMTESLSGLRVEYAILLVSSTRSGKFEASISFDVGQGTQDIGFRAETSVLFDVRPAREVQLKILDVDGSPTVARLTFRDSHGRVYPQQAKRLAPDFFFQSQIYRRSGDVVQLPPGQYTLTACRGPEYRETKQPVVVPEVGNTELLVQLQRWIDPMKFGFYCGDHHIHGAGCSHYTMPTEGVRPEDMFLQIKGEGLNVGCVLTWGPCYDFQRQYFSPRAADISEPFTVMKYDLEISGFGSAAMGHVCLLRLKDQTYPGSDGTKVKGWPTWTIPALRWAKQQGGVTGYPHSDMRTTPEETSRWMIRQADSNNDELVDATEATKLLLPAPMSSIDVDEDRKLSLRELTMACDRHADALPNFVLPSMAGGGAMEIFVSVPEGVCDFNSSMDTGRIGEWNVWYHLMNCGFPLKTSGETDFPCMSSTRVGQGRTYVRLGQVDRVDFHDWCEGIKQGQSYVSDGFAHALEFTVDDQRPGASSVNLEQPRSVAVRAKVAFASETPAAVAHGTLVSDVPRREVGDTRVLHAPRSQAIAAGGERLVEIVRNGEVVAKKTVPADGQIHDLEFQVPIESSSWIALRHFPQLHTNPVSVLVAGKPIRASRRSAQYCQTAVELLWHNRQRFISESERPAARAAYDRAIAIYQQRATEAVAE